MSILKFKCRCCGSYHDLNRDIPDGLSGWSYLGMEWSDFDREVPPLSQKRSRITKEVTKIGSDVIPQKGQIRTIRVYSPFEEEKGNVFFINYVPVSVYLRGFTDADDFERSAVVRCRFIEIISADDYNAWIKVEVLDVMMLSQIIDNFCEYKTEKKLEDFGTSCSCDEIVVDDEPWKFICFDIQGDVTESKFIYKDKNGVSHIVCMLIEDFFTNISYFGNIVQDCNAD